MESTFYPYLGALGWTGLFLLIGTIMGASQVFLQKLILFQLFVQQQDAEI